MMQGLHALVFEQLAWPAVGDAQPVGEEQFVVVQHQPEDQNQDQRAEVEELLDGVNQQEHSNAQKQPHPAFNFLPFTHGVGDGHRNDQGAQQVDGHVGEDFAARRRFLLPKSR